MRSCVLIGAGAIGLLYASILSRSGVKVTVISSFYRKILDEGVHIYSYLCGDWVWYPDYVYPSVQDCLYQPDLLIVATKAYAEKNILPGIKTLVSDNTMVALFQNGLDIELPYASFVPKERLIRALLFVCVFRESYRPNHIHHIDHGGLTLGTYTEEPSDFVKKLLDWFSNTEVVSRLSRNIYVDVWKKLLWNVPFNALSVIAGGRTTSELLSSERMERLIYAIMDEVCSIAALEGVMFSQDTLNKIIDGTKKMKPYKTSMLLDFENKKPMEKEAILGKVIDLADKHGHKVYHLEQLYAILNLMEFQYLKN